MCEHTEERVFRRFAGTAAAEASPPLRPHLGPRDDGAQGDRGAAGALTLTAEAWPRGIRGRASVGLDAIDEAHAGSEDFEGLPDLEGLGTAAEDFKDFGSLAARAPSAETLFEAILRGRPSPLEPLA